MTQESLPPLRNAVLSEVRHSVRKKLTLVVLATTLVALLLTGAAMMVYDLRSYHQSWVSDMFAQADLIGRATAPALAFDDEKVARQNLSLLKGNPRISQAAIYTAKGGLFATFTRADNATPDFPRLPEAEGYRIEGNQLILYKRIEHNNEILGSVYFEARYELMDRVQSYLIILAAVMAASLLVSLLMTSWLQASVTKPILEMTAVARQVMTQRDFSLRVRKSTDDEIGYLVDTFNAMLGEIGGRAQALEESMRSLELEMTERRSAEKALLAADRQKDEFLATLAHELRNPLAPLRNALEILRRTGADTAAAQAARDMMERQLRQLVHLVNDLLDVSRISTGKMVLKKERCEIHEIVQIALESAGPLVESRKHTLEVKLPREQVYVMADATRIAQVFVNLLNNAAKFTDVGGRIGFEARMTDGMLEVTVSDSGVGIPPDMLPVIFDMFAQVDRTLERAQAGLGVGLSLARYLVELHGGTIVATSSGLGKGTQLTVRLPTLASVVPKATQQLPAPAAPPEQKAGWRILLADDNIDFAASLAMLLEDAGNTVKVTNDGEEALAAAPEFMPDFCFLDIGLPKLHGYELAKKLRQLPATRSAVLVAVSGWGQEEDKRRSREAGFDHHLVKPVEPDQILDVLVDFAPAGKGQGGTGS